MADEVSKRLEAMKALADVATPGPWYAVESPWGDGGWVNALSDDPHAGMFVCDCQHLGGVNAFEPDERGLYRPDDNAAFIAAARQAVPWLLNAVATLMTAVQVAGGTITETPTGVNVSGMPFLRMNGTYTEVDISRQRDVDHA